ncbi:hypothetical protein RRG08_036050 [Elysia crispata]|uniref:Uncharacterized protein n=1 Tax=Elysia crispata TaxID=231223 RepID=A0AAE1AL39_9GAST|nr:hypothetical protein RRG08_036050 [Elysia crispata]
MELLWNKSLSQSRHRISVRTLLGATSNPCLPTLDIKAWRLCSDSITSQQLPKFPEKVTKVNGAVIRPSCCCSSNASAQTVCCSNLFATSEVTCWSNPEYLVLTGLNEVKASGSSTRDYLTVWTAVEAIKLPVLARRRWLMAQ